MASCSPLRVGGLRGLASSLAVAAAVAAPASAQVNIERLRLGADSMGFTGAASISVTLESGNAEKQRGDGQLRLDWLRPSTQSFVILSGDFDWTGGRRVSNKGLAHLRHIWAPRRRVSPEVFAQINYDQARDLDHRELLGAGARIRVARGSRGHASLGLAYMFEHEELGIPAEATHPRTTSHHRLSSFLTVSFAPRQGLALASTSYVQPRLDDVDDLRVLSQSRLAVQLIGPLSLDVTFDLAYDADPPDEVERLDTSLKTGIGVRFQP